jgi:hypothetical protein
MFWVKRYLAAALAHIQALQRRRGERLRREYNREDRGMALLKEWLSDEQRLQLEECKHFDVVGCHSGKRYRIQYGSAANVFELDRDERARFGWCFIPLGDLVPGDVMLAQKIMLESDERGALAVAKRFLPR